MRFNRNIVAEFIPTSKICSCCRGDLPLGDFYASDVGMFGVMSTCKVCGGFQNHNRLRKKKGLPPISLEEYKLQSGKNQNLSRREYSKRIRLLGKKIEALFVLRWEEARAAHRDKLFTDNYGRKPNY